MRAFLLLLLLPLLLQLAVTQYMKLIGMSFLQACIEEPIKELFESKASFELDTAKGGKEENLRVCSDAAARMAVTCSTTLFASLNGWMPRVCVSVCVCVCVSRVL